MFERHNASLILTYLSIWKYLLNLSIDSQFAQK